MASQGVVPPKHSRARNLALTGPKDPRYPSVQKMLQFQLADAKPVADSLYTFLRKVYQSKSLMNPEALLKWPTGADGKPVNPKLKVFGDTLADKIYDLYTAETKSPSGRTEDGMRKLLQTLDTLAYQYASVLDSIVGQSYRWELDAILGTKGADFIALCNQFLFFIPRSGTGATVRVYANAKYEMIPDVVKTLLEYLKAQPASHGMANFKIAGPAMAKRSDSIVIYCGSKQAADAVVKQLLPLGDHFNMAVPEMTSRQHDTIGISTGAEPSWQATGLGANKGSAYENDADLRKRFGDGGAAYAPQSFGTIRSQAIAAAILNFKDNLDSVNENLDTFARFVSVAFTGMGLDPTNPGS